MKGKIAKMKPYEFTQIEMLAIRDALIEQHQRLRKVDPQSPIFFKIKAATEALKEQFKEDCINI